MIKRGIFKANDIRGITEGSDPEWDAAGAYAIGAAVVEVLDLNRGAGAGGGPRHADQWPADGGCLH